jgi:hypothetical protein
METNVGLIVDGDDIRGRYLNMLYTAFLMLIGEGMDMETSLERAFGALVVLIGTIVTAVIVGNVSFVVSNQNSTQFQYQQKVDMITDEMRALHLPGEFLVFVVKGGEGRSGGGSSGGSGGRRFCFLLILNIPF